MPLHPSEHDKLTMDRYTFVLQKAKWLNTISIMITQAYLTISDDTTIKTNYFSFFNLNCVKKQDGIHCQRPMPLTAFSVPNRNQNLEVGRKRRRNCQSENPRYCKEHG